MFGRRLTVGYKDARSPPATLFAESSSSETCWKVLEFGLQDNQSHHQKTRKSHIGHLSVLIFLDTLPVNDALLVAPNPQIGEKPQTP